MGNTNAASRRPAGTLLTVLVCLMVYCLACSDDSKSATEPDLDSGDDSRQEDAAGHSTVVADVTAVEVRGGPEAYTFAVTVSSPDTGCDQYADWWEVLGEGGELIYRRVLLHSHTGEQPFTRTGGPVEIREDDLVWVRAHMNNGGYGGQALSGSAEAGFAARELASGFAASVATEAPLPVDCDF